MAFYLKVFFTFVWCVSNRRRQWCDAVRAFAVVVINERALAPCQEASRSQQQAVEVLHGVWVTVYFVLHRPQHLQGNKSMDTHTYRGPKRSGPRLNIKTVFPGMGIPMLKIRWSQDLLIFNMGILILVRRHLFIEMAPSWYFADNIWNCSSVKKFCILKIKECGTSLKHRLS